jgi:hypothetical protein
MAEGDSKDRKQQLKDAKARLAVEKDIANIAERASRSLKDYSDVVTKIRDIDKEILALTKEIENSTGEEKEELEQILATQQQISKQLKKELSLTKAIGKEMGGAMLGALSKQTHLLSSGLSMYYDIDEKVRETSMSLGLSAGRMKQMSQSAQNVAGHYAAIGLSGQDAVEAQAAYSEEVGRTVMMSEKALKTVGDLGLKTGLGAKGVAEMAGQMEQFGMGSTVALDYISEVRDVSQAMGINSGKVLKKVQTNAKLLHKLNFKGGAKGLAKMAAYSEKFKISMDSVAASAEKVFSPEGAIETAASLQMLGGGFSKLADPFKLMFDARNDPEQYAKGIVDSLTGIAKFKDGEFIVSAYELQRLEEAGKALGFSKEEMAEMAKQKAKMDKIGGSLMGFDKKDQELLSGMIEFDKNGKAIIGDKNLKDMKKQDLDILLQQQKTSEQNTKDAMSARQQWEAIGNQMIAATLPLMEWLNQFLEPITKTISAFIEKTPPWVAAIGAGLLIAVGKVAEWYLKGYQMGLGFNAASEKGGMFKRLKNFVTGKSKQSSVADSFKPRSVGMDKAKGSSMGKQGGLMKKGGMNPGSMIKGAAAMVILAGALFVFAKALQEFDKLENGWETLAMAGVAMVGLTIGLWALSKIPTANLIEGAFAMVVMGAAFIPLAYGLSLLQGLSWDTLAMAGVALVGVTAAVLGLGAIMMSGVGAAAIILGAAALSIMGLSLMVFGAGLAMVVDPISKFIVSLSEIGPMGTDLLMASVGIMALGGSLLFLGAAMAMGGWLGLLALGVAAESVGTAFNGIDGEGISQSVDAINNVDMEKINALKELSTAMSVWGMFGSKPIQVEMKASGSIALGDGTDTNASFDISKLSQSQLTELKNLIFQKQQVDSTGGV